MFVRDQCLVKQNMCQGMYCRDSGCHPAEMIEIKMDRAVRNNHGEKDRELTYQEIPDMSARDNHLEADALPLPIFREHAPSGLDCV